MKSPSQLGQEVEENAVKWFIAQRGGILLYRNFRRRSGEIDFIVEEPSQDRSGSEHSKELVFVEVRSRKPGGYVNGIESIGTKKLQRLLKTAQSYLIDYNGPAQSIRFDILHWNGSTWEHLPQLDLSPELLS